MLIYGVPAFESGCLLMESQLCPNAVFNFLTLHYCAADSFPKVLLFMVPRVPAYSRFN